MRDVPIGPTNDRSVVGALNEFAFHGEYVWKDGLRDLEALSLRMASLILGPLHHRSGSPDRELAAVVGGTEPLAKVIAFPGQTRLPSLHRGHERRRAGALYQLEVTLVDTKGRATTR